MKNLYRRAREYLSVFSIVMFFIALISLVFYLIVINSVNFADFFNYHMTTPVRQILAQITSLVPFSVAETLLFSIPILFFLFFRIGVKKAIKEKKETIKFVTNILSIFLYVFVTFVWTYSSGFHGSTIDKKMGLDSQKLSKEDLYDASIVITNELNELSKSIMYDDTNASILPYDYYQLSDKLYSAYEKYENKYNSLKNFRTILKPIILSEPMTYTHIAGVYTFFTGESNINVNYPDFVVTVSSAHEMAHQRGIARENEANFVAFVVLDNSDDEFLRYSAYLDVYSTIMSALYSVDKELHGEVYYKLDGKVRADLNSYSSFFDRYRDSKVSEITSDINDSYLQANGQKDGVKSYGMIVDLTCAYLKNKK